MVAGPARRHAEQQSDQECRDADLEKVLRESVEFTVADIPCMGLNGASRLMRSRPQSLTTLRSMPVLMMHVRDMRMPVPHSWMSMGMRVGLARWIAR